MQNTQTTQSTLNNKIIFTSTEDIQHWLTDRLTTILEISPDEFDTHKALVDYGLDSLAALELSGELESLLECRLSASLLYEHPSVEALSRYLSHHHLKSSEAKSEENTPEPVHNYLNFINPYLGDQLKRIRLDKSYVRGEGCYLFDHEGKQYLDFLGAYGALPFGFNPDEIWCALMDVHQTKEPSFVQPSMLEAAGELSRRLIEVAPKGLSKVTFCNSGTEAIEAAIKLARSATGRMGILSTHNSFHGKTLGALSATNRSTYQKAFGAPIPFFEAIPFGDLTALKEFLAARASAFAAFIVEPIQGEGGIRIPPPGYLKEVENLCREYGVLLIVDEVQTGLGRTGKLFACEAENVTPDILVLAKALGGGLIPIGALLCKEEVYNPDFAFKHSSTFAGNTLSCRVGLKTLEVLTRNEQSLIQQVAQNGSFLLDGLKELQKQYPHLIREVRGKGFLLGVEIGITRDTFGWDSLLGILAEQEKLTHLLTSYLLNKEHLRVATALNGANVIRIEPPLIAGRKECQFALSAFSNMLKHLSEQNTAKFIDTLLGKEKTTPATNVIKFPKRTTTSPQSNEGRWAFIGHLVDPKQLMNFDPTLNGFSNDDLFSISNTLTDLIDPFVAGTTRISSINQGASYGEFILLPRTPNDLLKMPRAQAVAEVESAVQLAQARGARIVGLGAYTSVVSGSGTLLKNRDIAITSGNSYTVVAGMKSVLKVLRLVDVAPENISLAVLGAAGSIGRGIALLASEKVKNILLIGNPNNASQSLRRLREIGLEICKSLLKRHREGIKFSPGSLGDKICSSPNLPAHDSDLQSFAALLKSLEQKEHIQISLDVNASLIQADVVISATSTLEKLITPNNIKNKTIICDLSRPRNVSDGFIQSRPDVLVIDGGLIAVPGMADLGFNFGFNKGLAFACMAETMIWGLEKHYKDTSLGSKLDLATILTLQEKGDTHGFKLAEFHSFDKPLDSHRWEKWLENYRIN